MCERKKHGVPSCDDSVVHRCPLENVRNEFRLKLGPTIYALEMVGAAQ
jgi:hypothetical protein